MKTIINHLQLLFTIALVFNCGCYSINEKSLSNKKKKSPLLLEIKLPKEINLRNIVRKAVRTSRDLIRKTNKFKKELSKEFNDQSNWKHYLSIGRPISFIITNTSPQSVHFLWRYAKISIKLKNKESGENIVCKYVKKTAKSFFGSLGAFDPKVVLTSLEPGEYIIGYINPADCYGFPNPKNYNDVTKTPWDLTIEMEFLACPFTDVDMLGVDTFSGNLKSNMKKVIIYPLSEEKNR